MSVWTDRLSSHPVFQQIAANERLLEAAGDTVAAMPDQIEAFDRLRQVMFFARRALNALDPNLCTPSMLDTMQNRLAAIHGPLAEFAQRFNPSSLEQANGYGDSLLDQIYVLTAAKTGEDAQDIREAVTALRQSVGQNVRRNNEEVEASRQRVAGLDRQISSLEATISTQTARLDAALDRFQSQFSNAQESRSNEFAQAQGARADANRDVDRAREASIAELMENLSSEARDALRSFESSKEAALSAVRETRGKLELELDESAGEHLRVIGLKRNEAEEIVGIIAQTGMAGGYQKIANEERKSGEGWLKIAIAAFVGLIGSALLFLIPWFGDGTTWEALATRVYLSLTFAALAGFAAKQASNHQQTERRSRQMELELASVGPFLVQLPEDERHKLLSQFADRMFGQTAATIQASSDVRLPAPAMADLLKTALDAIVKK